MYYSNLDTGQFTELRKKLIKKENKGSKLQLEFIESTRSNDKFIEFVRTRVRTGEGKEIPILSEKLTEFEYKDPPIDTEHRIYDVWKMVPPADTCNASFWGEVTLKQIENGCIEASYLAANGGSLAGGRERVDRCLALKNINNIDQCVRTILRRMGGLPDARGNRSTFVDCPFGRAWWRERLLEEVVNATNLPTASVQAIFHLSQSYWECLVELMVSRNSILGSSKVRHALIWVLVEIREKALESRYLTSKELKKLCTLLGVRCAWQELGVLEIVEIKYLITKEIIGSINHIR